MESFENWSQTDLVQKLPPSLTPPYVTSGKLSNLEKRQLTHL